MDIPNPDDSADAIIQSIEEVKETIGHASFEHHDPAKAAEVIGRRGAGDSIRYIAKTTGVSVSGVQSIIKRHPEVIAEIQESTGRMAVTNTHLSFEVYAQKMRTLRDDPEQLAKVSPKDLAIAAGVMVDKAQLLQGKATSIHENLNEPTFADAQALIRQAQGRVIDVEEDD
jgi:predicted transcriptional regulator